MHLISLKKKVRLLEGDRGSAARSVGGGIWPKMGSSLMNRVERWAGLWLASVLCAGAMAGTAPLCNAQSKTTQSKKPAAKKEPTSAELFAYIRGALLQYTADDGANDNLEVAIDPTATVLTIKQPDGHCDIFLNALDASTISWDVYDATDSMQTRAPLARLSVVSVAGKKARTCYDPENNIDPAPSATRARILFSWEKIPEGSGFQAKFTKAFKKLITHSGGAAEVSLFK